MVKITQNSRAQGPWAEAPHNCTNINKTNLQYITSATRYFIPDVQHFAKELPKNKRECYCRGGVAISALAAKKIKRVAISAVTANSWEISLTLDGKCK
jgi:metal-dependent HD superfamily phosphatase/phosphodiesterase